MPYGARCRSWFPLRTPSPRTRVRPPGWAQTEIQKTDGQARESDAREAMCLMIESAARASNLPLEFFARVIWQESRFQLRCGGAGDAQRPARAGDCAVHAGNGERTRPARSLQSRAGVAEIGRVSRRVARPVRQSRDSRPPPIMPARGGCRSGWPAPVGCRRRPAATSSPSPARRSRSGPTAGRAARCRSRRRRRVAAN